MAGVEQFKDLQAYDVIHDLVSARMSMRKLKPDPVPDGAPEKILEVARWAMSGANGQPWEYIIVKDPEIKKQLFDAYHESITDFIFWMEQQRSKELRHPSYFRLEGSLYEALHAVKNRPGWDTAPALIVVLGDGRRQWATVQGGHTFGRHQTHLTDGLANTCTLIHLAAASMGLGTQWVTIHIEDPFKRILNVPDLLMVYLIIPIGYPALEPKEGSRRPLQDMVHYDQYDMSKYMSNEAIIDYIAEIRGKTVAKYPQPGEQSR